MLLVIETHPIQYHAPVYRLLQNKFGVPVTVIYGSDFSVKGYQDEEFNSTFAWDTDLLSGYTSFFLSKVAEGGPAFAEGISAHGITDWISHLRPKAILLTGFGSKFYREAAHGALKTGYPILFRAETTDHARRRNFLQSWIRDAALSHLYKKCAKLIVIGERSRRHFERLGFSGEKLIFSPYSIDEVSFEWDEISRQRLRMETRKQLGIRSDMKVILFSGKLSHRKGPDLLMKALKRFDPQTRGQMALIFMGDGELKKDLELLTIELTKLETHFIGFKNQSQLSAYYHAADILVLPSRYSETWGLVVNEALQHGLPCVVSDQVGCAPDLIESRVTGEIFESEDVKKLATAIQRTLSLTGNEDIRRKCREKVSNYSLEKSAEGLAKAYQSVVP